MPTLKVVPANGLDPKTGYFKLLLDGNKLAEILGDKEKEFEIPAGSHKLKASLGWLSSNEIDFTIGENETRTFAASKLKYNQYFLWSPLVLILINPLVRRYYGVDLYLLAMGLLVILFVHKFFIMKNKFMMLEPVN